MDWRLEPSPPSDTPPRYDSVEARRRQGQIGRLLALQSPIANADFNVQAPRIDHLSRRDALPADHADPFDRQIIAQAMCEGIAVVTYDETFRMYEGVKIVS